MCICVHNGSDGGPCPLSECLRHSVIPSDGQAGRAASRIRGLGAGCQGGCKSGSDTGESNVTRWLLEGSGGSSQLLLRPWVLGLTETSSVSVSVSL